MDADKKNIYIVQEKYAEDTYMARLPLMPIARESLSETMLACARLWSGDYFAKWEFLLLL